MREKWPIAAGSRTGGGAGWDVRQAGGVACKAGLLAFFFHACQGGCGAPRVGLGQCAGVGRVRRRELAACGGGSWAAGECGPHAEKREAGRCALRAELRRGVGFLFFSYSYFFSLFLFQTTPILFEFKLEFEFNPST